VEFGHRWVGTCCSPAGFGFEAALGIGFTKSLGLTFHKVWQWESITLSVDSTGTIEAITVPFGDGVTGLRVAYFAAS
jgi:hypothetical protein